MSTLLRSIIWVKAHEYEVTLDVEGVTRRCICRVSVRDGVRVVEAFPDFLPSLGVSPRMIASAVLATDSVNQPSLDTSEP